MSNSDQLILLDPYPRVTDVIFSPKDKTRLEWSGRVIWHDGARWIAWMARLS